MLASGSPCAAAQMRRANDTECAARLTKRFSVVVKTHKHRSNKIYKTELTKKKI